MRDDLWLQTVLLLRDVKFCNFRQVGSANGEEASSRSTGRNAAIILKHYLDSLHRAGWKEVESRSSTSLVGFVLFSLPTSVHINASGRNMWSDGCSVSEALCRCSSMIAPSNPLFMLHFTTLLLNDFIPCLI